MAKETMEDLTTDEFNQLIDNFIAREDDRIEPSTFMEEIEMLNTVEGIYRNGHIELIEAPAEITEARVIVTFLPLIQPLAANEVNLRERGIDEAQAASLRARLRAFAEDWDRPEMEVYDAL